MKYRQLGKTGLSVSEVGFGAWGIGGGLWQGGVDGESQRALEAASDHGVNFIDTALAYGRGHSEQLVGSFVKQRGKEIYIATKIPPKNGKWPAQPGSRLQDVFPAAYIRECTEKSLKNLGVDRIDVQQFHVWNDEWTDEPEWLDTITKLKEEGKIRFFGVSINDHQPENALRLIQSGNVDTVQVIYNIFDQSPRRRLFDVCREHKIGVIVRVPFDEGALTGNISPETTFPEGDFRNRYFRGERKKEVEGRIAKLKPLLGEEAQSLPELALRFCLQPDAVSTVIPGMRTVSHVEKNVSVSDGRKLSDQLTALLSNHVWDRNFYG